MKTLVYTTPLGIHKAVLDFADIGKKAFVKGQLVCIFVSSEKKKLHNTCHYFYGATENQIKWHIKKLYGKIYESIEEALEDNIEKIL